MKSLFTLAFACCAMLLLPIPAQAQFSAIFGSDKTVAQQQEEILKRSKEILELLYQSQPKAKTLIDNAVGYATFSNFGMKILIAGGGSLLQCSTHPISPESSVSQCLGSSAASDAHSVWVCGYTQKQSLGDVY